MVRRLFAMDGAEGAEEQKGTRRADQPRLIDPQEIQTAPIERSALFVLSPAGGLAITHRPRRLQVASCRRSLEGALQFAHLIAQKRGLFELQIVCGREHLALEFLNRLVQIEVHSRFAQNGVSALGGFLVRGEAFLRRAAGDAWWE